MTEDVEVFISEAVPSDISTVTAGMEKINAMTPGELVVKMVSMRKPTTLSRVPHVLGMKNNLAFSSLCDDSHTVRFTNVKRFVKKELYAIDIDKRADNIH